MANRTLHIDFETFSSQDLKIVGLENYVKAKDFAVTVIAWCFDAGPVKSRRWPNTMELPDEILAHIYNGGEVRAWNASFEREIIREHYRVDISPAQVVCVMQKALAYGLPGGLLKAGQAMKMTIIKDETKRSLMLRMSKPRTGKIPYHEDPGEGQKLIDLDSYCCDDVRAEGALDNAIPELHPFEQKLSMLDQAINERGVKIDTLMVARLMTASVREILDIGLACKVMTNGHVTSPGTQTEKLRQWLASQGCPLSNVNKETVEQAIGQVSDGAVKVVLGLRQMAAKSSTAKLQKMNSVKSMQDDRARYLLQFYGAGRTGRWAGRTIQPQNLPRVPAGFDPDQTAKLAADTMGLRTFYRSPMDAISKCLRGCLIADQGKVLLSVDLSQIEARVLAWLAAQEDVLDAFRRGEDVYMLQARKVGSTNRDLGKVLVLACGFGMGWLKFLDTARKSPYNIQMNEAMAKLYLDGWRLANPMIVGYWTIVENAVRASVRYPGRVIGLTNNMAVRTENGVTQIRKPNGVKLTYHNMRIENGGLVFDGVNSLTKKWGTERTYGGRLVENLTQSIARDVMAEQMLRVPDGIVMCVHDEIVWETAQASGDHRRYLPKAPAWASDLPVDGKVVIGRRYAK
jgi:DNA polymerase bacteriophage-type